VLRQNKLHSTLSASRISGSQARTHITLRGNDSLVSPELPPHGTMVLANRLIRSLVRAISSRSSRHWRLCCAYNSTPELDAWALLESRRSGGGTRPRPSHGHSSKARDPSNRAPSAPDQSTKSSSSASDQSSANATGSTATGLKVDYRGVLANQEVRQAETTLLRYNRTICFADLRSNFLAHSKDAVQS
jgi:hypothetical protein